MSQNNAPLYIVVRIKGQQGLHPDVKKTLELLRLHKKFHVVLVRANESMKGMLKKVEHTITYGEAEPDTIALLLERRGRIKGGKRLTIDYIKPYGYNSFEKLAEALINGEISLKKIKGLKPVFRLRPPSKGFKGTIKKHFRDKGEYGYRGKAINELIRRML